MTDNLADVMADTPSDPRVEKVLGRLDRLDTLNPAEQLLVFSDLQVELAAVLDSPEGVDEVGVPSAESRIADSDSPAT